MALDPTTGRWTAMDPIGFAAGDANLYRYVGNDSVGRIDPTGLLQAPGGVQLPTPGNDYTLVVPVAIHVTGDQSNRPEVDEDIINGIQQTWNLPCFQRRMGEFNDPINLEIRPTIVHFDPTKDDPKDVTYMIIIDSRYTDGRLQNKLPDKQHPYVHSVGNAATWDDYGRWGYAHEFAHSMGFEDKYDDTTQLPLPGYGNTLMGSPRGTVILPYPNNGLSELTQFIDKFVPPDANHSQGK